MKKLAVLALFFILLAHAAFASNKATTPVSIILSPGCLTIDLEGEFSFLSVEIDGQPKTLTPLSAPKITVSDNRGSGEGWSVDLTCTTLKAGEGDVPVKQLNLDFTNSESQDISCVSGDSQNLPSTLVVDQTSLANTVKVIQADPGEGMGTYTTTGIISTDNFSVPVASAQYADNYIGTFTATIYPAQ